MARIFSLIHILQLGIVDALALLRLFEGPAFRRLY